ncbi:hypothetical protein V8F33_000792 [Rhypophila sp. PSN 637]
MVFTSPSWVPDLPFEIPDSIPIADFMRNDKYRALPLSQSKAPFTCGLTGTTYSWATVLQRVEFLARGLSAHTGWQPNEGVAWDKVVGIFCVNTIDYIPLCYATHRLNGIPSLANMAYSAQELTHQLTSSSIRVLFTCQSLLPVALQAADAAGLPRSNIFLVPQPTDKLPLPSGFKTTDDLLTLGRNTHGLEALRWSKGQARRQPAFLCYSSGTSGLPKAVMISHYNVIANAIQTTTYESVGRKAKGVVTQVMLGLLPMSHIYSLVLICHTSVCRGDNVVILPKFELDTFLGAIQRFKIEQLTVVPPIIVRLLAEREKCRQFDLSSVRLVYCGAAPLGKQTIEELLKIYPSWTLGQGYGMTESAVGISSTGENDVLVMSSGSLLPGVKAKLVDVLGDGREITELEKPGELWIQSPSVVLGYLHNEKANMETFVWDNQGRWLRTGDEVMFVRGERGHEHLVVVDRIKELIKVKGHQVAPAELEAHILAHDAVADCAVIQVPDERSGEVPKAFVVRSAEVKGRSDDEVARMVLKHVEDHKASYKWIKGGVEFVAEIPKSPSGKILRRLLRDREREKRKAEGAKL